MGADVLKYIGVISLLILVYLLVQGGQNTTGIINALSGANTNAILALQGRQPSVI